MLHLVKKLFTVLLLLQVSTLFAQWKSIGPNGGSVLKFIEHDSIMLAVTTDGGIYRSTDKGVSWYNPTFRTPTPILDGITSDGRRLYATSEKQLYLSNDFGLSWEPPKPIPESGTAFIAASDSFILLSNSGYIYYSRNKGTTWSNLGLNLGQYDQAINAVISRDSLFVAVRFDDMSNNSLQIFKSPIRPTLNWQLMNSFPTESGYNDHMFAIDSNYVYVETSHSLRISKDFGKTFDSISPSSLLGFDPVDWMFSAKGSRVVVTKNYTGTWVSTDTCRTWSPLASQVYLAHALPGKPMMIGAEGYRYCPSYQALRYFGKTGEGIYNYNPSSYQWIPSNQGFTNTDINTLVFAGGRLYTFDRKRQQNALFYSANQGQTWTNETYFPYPIVSLTANNFYVFIGTAEQGLFRSVAGSDQWLRIDTAVSIERFINQLMDGASQIFYQANILTTRNHWRMNRSRFKNMFIYKYTVFAHGYDSVSGNPTFFKSTDYATSWSNLSTPFGAVKLMAANQQFLFTVTGELSSKTSEEGLYRSADGGYTWEKLNHPLQQDDVVKSIGCYNDVLLLASADKVIVSRDNGLTWSDMSDSVPDHITCFQFNNNQLYAGTQYKGIWKRNSKELFGEPPPDRSNEPLTIKVFPNPFEDVISITGNIDLTNYIQIELLDMSGRLILQSETTNTQTGQIQLRTGELAEGVYVLKIRTNKGSFVYKMAKYYLY